VIEHLFTDVRVRWFPLPHRHWRFTGTSRQAGAPRALRPNIAQAGRTVMDPKNGRVLVDVGLFGIYAIASTIGLVVVKSTLPTLQSGSPAFLQFTGGFVLYVMSFGVWIVILARFRCRWPIPSRSG